MKQKLLVTFCFGILSCLAFAQTWTNPLTLSSEWPSYGIGDPYVLKYRGTYYLYCSTKDSETGVKCWSSNDLVSWTYRGLCATDPLTKGAYAPEVIYYNGAFYMYTSPAGDGHYVLKSDSPIGPFTIQTGNLGLTIDGSVFKEDNGALYFYHASVQGLKVHPMTDPVTIGAETTLSATRMNAAWTEGPCVVKRQGKYYLLATGNHILSKGYRINYSMSSTSPTGGFSNTLSANPVVLRTEGKLVGLGHGTLFMGPDLDTYYLTYHNLVSTNGPVRQLDFDPVAFNGDRMMVLGPTESAQQTPRLPVFQDYFNRAAIGTTWTMPNGGTWNLVNQDYLTQTANTTETWYKTIHTTATGANYTAEFNVQEVTRGNDNARYGALFGYTDEQNYGIAVLRSKTNQLEVNFQVNGVWGTAQLATLPGVGDYTKWHTLRIEKLGSNYTFFVDDMQKMTAVSTLGAGKIGYMTSWTHANFAYVAFNNHVQGSAIFDVYKPIPGQVAAVYYNTGGEGNGYHDVSVGNSGGKYIRADNVDIQDHADGGFAIGSNTTGEWYKYNIMVPATGKYNVGIRYAAAAAARIRILENDVDVSGTIDLPATGSLDTWQTHILSLRLTAGTRTLKVETVSGECSLYTFEFTANDNSAISRTETFDNGLFTNWNYTDGPWVVVNKEASITGTGKCTLGSTGWTNYIVDADVTYISGFNAGLMVRVNNPSQGGNGTDAVLGTDFYQGYFIGLTATSVVLGKQNYNWTPLTTAPGTFVANTKYHFRVALEAGNIQVFVDDMTTPKINYTDSRAWVSGKVGLRSLNTTARFDNIFIYTKEALVTGVDPYVLAQQGMAIYPTPTAEVLTIQTVDSRHKQFRVYTTTGQLVLEKEGTGTQNQLSVKTLPRGMYILKVSSPYLNAVQKLMVE